MTLPYEGPMMPGLFRILLLRRAHVPSASSTLGCVLTCCTFLLLLLPVASAWGGTFSPGRMVYVNGELHRIWISGGYLYHQPGKPGDPVNGTGDFTSTGPSVKGYSVCRYHTTASNEGIAVFNNKIYVAYTRDTVCNNSGSMSAYVATFDLTPTDTYPQGHWSRNYKAGPVQYKTASGAAITVFKGQLYLFTDTATYTSGDGVSWSSAYPPIQSGKEPLDAVTIYPEDDPKILLVFGTATSGGNYFDQLHAATWNGNFSSSIVSFPSCIGGTTGCLSNPIVDRFVAGRVALLPGTRKADPGISGSKSGSTLPSVQLFAQLMNDTMRVREYHVKDNSWYRIYDAQQSQYEIDYPGFTGLMVYPWFVSACDDTGPGTLVHQARHQRFVALGGSTRPVFDSDYMVPQNNPSPTTCDAAAGTENATQAENETTRKYWSLIGVVLGSPPFSLNGSFIPAEVKEISNVVYGSTTEGSTKHSQKWGQQNMISTGVEVHAGLFDDLLKINNSFDIEYKHDYESEHETKTVETTVQETRMGTDAYSEGVVQPVPGSSCRNDADCAQYADPFAGGTPACRTPEGASSAVCYVSTTGKTGWALFNAPTLYVQDYALYAYDYNKSTGSGTNLDQNLHTVEARGFSVVPVSFDLQHPELARNGILAGMQPFPYSTDFWGWNSQNWNRIDQPWSIKLGPGTSPSINTVTHDRAVNQGVQYTQGTETVDSSTQTTSNKITNTTGMEVGTGLLGFGTHLTVGTESSFSTSVSNTTTFEKNVKADLNMPDCNPGTPGCVTNLTVQPYLLQATGKAPWIPDLYPTTGSGPGAWCMAWTVTRKCPGGPNCNVTLTRIAAADMPPQNATGRIIGGNGGGAKEGERYSHYSLQGGQLAWMDSEGNKERIPITAEEFDPAKGVTIEVNGSSWSSTGKGTWKRSGNIWTFQTDPKAKKEVVTLKLDFGSATYDLHITKADLERHAFAGMTDVVLQLNLNGLYTFTSTIHHDVDINWQWSKPPEDNLTMHVTSFEGRYNSATRTGKMSIAGTLPAELPAFGDLGIVINGEEISVPLVSMDDFQEVFDSRGVFRYAKEGLNLVVDFGNKKWTATFNNKALSHLHRPRWGKISARILVGGLPWTEGEHAIVHYTEHLTLRR